MGYLGADVEVARGAKILFYPRAGYYDATHGSEGLGDVTLPAAENVPFTKRNGSGADPGGSQKRRKAAWLGWGP